MKMVFLILGMLLGTVAGWIYAVALLGEGRESRAEIVVAVALGIVASAQIVAAWMVDRDAGRRNESFEAYGSAEVDGPENPEARIAVFAE